MARYITDNCIGCTFCQNECPVLAISYDGDITCGRYVSDRFHKTEVVNDYSWAVTGGFMAAEDMLRRDA